MKTKKTLSIRVKYFFTISFIILILSQILSASTFIHADDHNIRYTGRINFSDPLFPVLYWPGTYITAGFTGTSVKIILADSSGDNYYNVFIDNESEGPLIVDCEKGPREYPIKSGLKDTNHTILIFRRTEGFSGPTVFKGFVLDDNKTLTAPPPAAKHKIEFFGDSITCGMGNECPDDGPDEDNAKRNNYLTYGAITARNLDAEYVCTAKSGIGIIVSWFDMIMPEYYDRLDPADPDSKWDFSRWTPDAVVINLFQNDSWLIKRLDPTPGPEQITDAYYNFIKTVRDTYPNATIFCTLGSMDATKAGSPWPGYIEAAAEKFKKDFNDTKIHYYFFKYDGTGKHPRVRHHQQMGKELTALIRSTLNW